MSIHAADAASRGHGVRARKSLGQHFLKDPGMVRKIVDAAEPSPEEIVIEVGPGTGALTRALACDFGKVIAVEIDTRLASLLEAEFAEQPNVVIVPADVRDLPPSEILARGGPPSADSEIPFKVVGNLPYYVASPIIRHFLESEPRPRKMVVTVQKEVGENMVAGPGRMGLLSLAVQIYGAPTIVARVPASKFQPKPKVDSVVVAIDVYRSPLVPDPQRFFKIARAGFRAPRKQLRNSLVYGLQGAEEAVNAALAEAQIDGRRRPSTLTIAEWDRLSRELG